MQITKTASASTNTTLLHLICQDGFSLTLSSLGASIRQLYVPFSSGDFRNIALSFSSESLWESNPLFAGATLAPTAGRIANGHLPLSNGNIQLSRNENDHHNLHGGFHNASFQNWTLCSVEETKDSACVTFEITLPDGLDGFPGNRQLKAIYTLTDQHLLTIRYEAISDKETYFNLSNHCYFNLSGNFSRPALDHVLQVNADLCLTNAPDFIPSGTRNVMETPFDFRRPVSLKQHLDHYSSEEQLMWNKGYNHGFILNRLDASPKTPEHDLICALPGSPLSLSISSDAPCMVLYSGGYIPEGLPLSDGQKTVPSCALAFEFQDYPDAPGGHGFSYATTSPGKLWSRTIRYQFDHTSSSM